MQAIASARLLRWAPWAGGALLVAGVVASLVVFMGGSSTPEPKAPGNQPAGGGAGTEKKVPFSPEAESAALGFIRTVVAGRQPRAGWKLMHPELRAGITYKQWLSGVSPVPPYPVDITKPPFVQIDESYARRAELQVILPPRKGANVRAYSFFLGLKAVGDGARKRWLVYYWQPRSVAPYRTDGESH